ncbi:hypothetical protein CASFOL_032341 [Castilleja foliolosa]|uniref:Uncharacterized protein n=1 Tax=Castilleja foliolosa TaxID=1961234 RepID=A0ABD3C173_9LAMI
MSNVYSLVLVLGLLFLATPLLARSVELDLTSFGETDHISEDNNEIWIFNLHKDNYGRQDDPESNGQNSHNHPYTDASGPHRRHHHHGRHHHHRHGGHHAHAPKQAEYAPEQVAYAPEQAAYAPEQAASPISA